MSAFFGEFRYDGQRVESARLRAMAEAIPWYDRDGRDIRCCEGLGLGVLQVHTTPESRHEPPILADATDQRWLGGNVRIDNREELIARLALTVVNNHPITDADIILAACAAWGADAPWQLLGDFAFAWWDSVSRELLLVRDHIGIAPLYYYPTCWGLIFASDLRGLAAHPEGPRALNSIAIVHHLRDAQYCLPDTTYLDGVRKLRPGHLLVATPAGYRETRYWSPADAPKVRLAQEKDYAQRLRELFTEAVACRLRTLDPVGTHLSGGLDSTAIALEAQRQLRARGAELASAYTWLPELKPDEDPDAPEYAATRRAEAALGLRAESVNLTPEALRRELERDIAVEGFADLWYETLVREKGRARGIRTLLSGWGGDEIVSSGVNGYAAELFWQGHWLRLARLIRSRLSLQVDASIPVSNQPVWRRTLGFLNHHVLLPSLPNTLYRRWPGRVMRPMRGYDPNAPEAVALGDRQPPLPDWQKKPGKRAEMERALMAGHLQARIETWASQGAQDGIRYVYPLLDRRLVEFCLGSPGSLFAQPDQTRGLFRQAMRGLLPEDIRTASVKIESVRVNKLVATVRRSLTVPCAMALPDAVDSECWMAATRHIQVQAMRVAHGPRRGDSVEEVR